MADELHDLSLAARRLRAQPGFAVAAILTLTLGVGVNTALFSVVYGVLLRPLPYRDARSLVLLKARKDYPTGSRWLPFSAPELEDWIGRMHSFDSLALVGGEEYAVLGETGMEPAAGCIVSDRFFETLGAPMALGRPIGRDSAPVVVVSHRLWRDRLGGDADAVGQQLTLNGTAFTVVGVTAPTFRFPDERTDLWTPLGFARAAHTPEWVDFPNGGGFQLVARLKRGVGLNQAQTEAEAVMRALDHEHPGVRTGARAVVTGLREHLTGDVRPALLVLFAATGLVLAVACANVASLLLARQVSRRRDLAVQVALGAPRRRLVAEALAETIWIAAAGCVSGCGCAAVTVVSQRWIPASLLSRADQIRIDSPTLLFAAAMLVGSALLCGVAPALHAARHDVAAALRASPALPGGRVPRRVRSALVVGQLAVSVVLLVGVGLLGRSLIRLLDADIGIVAEHVITAEIDSGLGRSVSSEQEVELARSLVARVRAIPGVRSAAVSVGLPPNRLLMRTAFRTLDAATGRSTDHLMDLVSASPEYFETLGIPLLRGRPFSSFDGPGAPPVALLSDDAARLLFGNREPVGETLPIGRADESGNRSPVTIVGVVGRVKYHGIAAATDGAVYRPFAQEPWSVLFLLARSSGDSRTLTAALRQAIRAADKSASVRHVRALDDIVAGDTALPRLRTALLAGLAGLALALAAVGLYGTVACSLAQRTTEIGIRTALGAKPSQITGMVLNEGARLAVVGIVIGLAAAGALAHVLESLLYGVPSHDAASFGWAAAVLLLVAFAAAYPAARRAARLDPAEALRGE